MTSGPQLSLIVPAYNAGAQLAGTLTALDEFRASAPVSVEVVFVDDCSTDGETAEALVRYAQARERVRVLRNPVNRGKGYGVARGMVAATGAYRVFTDFDLAYPLSQTLKILAALESGKDVAIACRVLPESRYVMSPSFFHYLYTRHLMSRAFNAAVRVMLLRDTLDTQAGLKGFTAAAAEAIFTRTTIAGFGFDVETLYIARRLGLSVAQVAVDFRYDEEPTTVHFVRDSMRMARDLVRIRWHGWTSRYLDTAGTFDLEAPDAPSDGAPLTAPPATPAAVAAVDASTRAS
ncbi:MAG: glycosyltransferase [Gemmatimonadaceae bacterium]